MDKTLALQDLVTPDGVCFGCGPKNEQGLRMKSYWDADNLHLIATYTPDTHHVGWPSIVYGGLISSLIDCHSAWTAMAHHYLAEGRKPGSLPRVDCVTGLLKVKYLKPTPIGVGLRLRARVEGAVKRSTRVVCEMFAGDVLTAVSDSIFVRVDVSGLGKTVHS